MSNIYSLCSLRELGLLPDNTLRRVTKDSEHLVRRLTETATLEGHNGCVNTVSWNEPGTHLLSGSDDCHLNIYDSASRKLLKSTHTTHRSNIFSAKFLPGSSNFNAVSCAGIGSVEYSELSSYGDYIPHCFNCQTSITYQVATVPHKPCEFLTCEDRGLVRLYDLRERNSCSCDGCQRFVVFTFPHAVTSMAVHPTCSHYVACGVGDGSVRLMDRRMAKVAVGSAGAQDQTLGSTHCQYKPHFIGDKKYKPTSVSFNPSGAELLASYSEDYVYLYSSRTLGCGGTASPDPSRLPLPCLRHYPSGKRTVETHVAPRHANLRLSSTTSKGRAPPGTQPAPVKRIRLRGDWSDTGPEARPDDHDVREESSLMRGVSRMLAQWINPAPPSPEPLAEHQSSESGSEDGSFNLFGRFEARPPTPPSRRAPTDAPLGGADVTPTTSRVVAPPTTRTFTSTIADITSRSVRRPRPLHARANVMSGRSVQSGAEVGGVDGMRDMPHVRVTEGSSDSDDEVPVESGQRIWEEEMEEEGDQAAGEDNEYLEPFSTYKGHRNSRTMIKQANFLGDSWVMSGSDCGRIFIWNKWTGEVVNMLVADSHVVNCIQPHPTAFVLASSGIDYNVKLWEPVSQDLCSLDHLDEIIERNEVMLRENRDTITLPPTFILWILAYLQRRRRRVQREETYSSDSD